MSAARLTTPNPTTARHGDQPGRGAGTTSGAGSGSAGGGGGAAGGSGEALLLSGAAPVPQPGRGAGTTSGAGSGSAGAGSVPPGCSDTVLLMSAALPVHHRRGATAACRRRSPQCGEQDGGRGAVGRMAALDVEALLVAVVD